MKRLIWILLAVIAVSVALHVFLPASFFAGTVLATFAGLAVLAAPLLQDARGRR
ncbi:hypothetical protein [Poseidonocella sp. HB161398]|uniref:hypothetical protein n=1 Tax=Poseidonocella sp. HB161398 TaxID=2320855 RepID=UPI00148676E3|nr:hypothetical protein [Poseidonocella sp. HB161398]